MDKEIQRLASGQSVLQKNLEIMHDGQSDIRGALATLLERTAPDGALRGMANALKRTVSLVTGGASEAPPSQSSRISSTQILQHVAPATSPPSRAATADGSALAADPVETEQDENEKIRARVDTIKITKDQHITFCSTELFSIADTRFANDFNWNDNPSISVASWWSKVLQKKSVSNWKLKMNKLLLINEAATDQEITTKIEEAGDNKWKLLIVILSRIDSNTFKPLRTASS